MQDEDDGPERDAVEQVAHAEQQLPARIGELRVAERVQRELTGGWMVGREPARRLLGHGAGPPAAAGAAASDDSGRRNAFGLRRSIQTSSPTSAPWSSSCGTCATSDLAAGSRTVTRASQPSVATRSTVRADASEPFRRPTAARRAGARTRSRRHPPRDARRPGAGSHRGGRGPRRPSRAARSPSRRTPPRTAVAGSS